MGQCSTLPAETRPSSSLASSLRRETTNSASPHRNYNHGAAAQGDETLQEQRKRLNEGGRKESLDFNSINDDPVQKHWAEVDRQMQAPQANIDKRSVVEQTQPVPAHRASPSPLGDGFQEDGVPQTRDDPSNMEEDVEQPEPMELDDTREEAPPAFPPPPEGSVRTRCYKLNLDSEIFNLSGQSTPKAHAMYGPFNEPPPLLTYCSSEDSADGPNPTKIAIQTAQIFRGITVSRDGTILTQNARATRSSRGSKNKRGEKSRQAAKIDKANDLVEEAVTGAGNNESDERPNMVSLVIMGEYDDMKYLIRDGSKRLRDADGASDEKLTSVNRPRHTSKGKSDTQGSTIGGSSSPRKRSSVAANVSSNSQSSLNPKDSSNQRTGVSPGPSEKGQAASQTNNSGANPAAPPSAHAGTSPKAPPPKLKSHPRDTRPGRREERTSTRMRLDSCHDFMDPRRAEMVGDGDWSHAWNIWNCGGTGTVSPPNHPSSPLDGGANNKAAFEGRDSSRPVREGGVAGRAS